MKKVVITGCGVVCNIAFGLTQLTLALREGRCGIHASEGRLGAWLHDFSWRSCLEQLALDSDTRRQATKLLTRAPLTVQVTVCAALQAWLAAGFVAQERAWNSTGIVIGGSNLANGFVAEQQAKWRETPEFIHPRYGFMFFDSYLVGVLSQLTGIRGAGYTVGGASASGNLAVMEGCMLVAGGHLDGCLVVGAMSELSPLELDGLRLIGAMHRGDKEVSPSSGCWPFDRSHRGFVPGQGAAAVMLESTDGAARRGAEALAEIAGYGQALAGTAGPEPSALGEAHAMRLAVEKAGWDLQAVDYLNAHGTASALGDRAECDAIRAVFGEHTRNLWVNATKGLVGHCVSAAGMVELVAILAQMQGGFLHPNLGLRDPIDDRLRFVGDRAVETRFRRALSNSFGFGGINTCLAVAATLR
jgi:malonyl-ACP decarboxylase